MIMVRSQRTLLGASVSLLSLLAGRALADGAPPPAVSEIVITATRLDLAQSAIEPSLGATTYSMPKDFITNLPAGANSQLNQVILQAPGVTQDGFGQLHVRGDHANIQFRLNNVILPEGLSVFGQAISPRLASNIDMITGALPAQYGLRTAAIINITTKSGFSNGGEVSLYGGSHGVVTPSVEYGGAWGNNSAFLSATYTNTDVGIESPDGRADPLHDHSQQAQVFGYFDHIIDPSSRLAVMIGTSQQTFEIPNVSGLHPDTGLHVGSVTDALSDRLNDRQNEGTTFVTASYLKTTEQFTGQASLFARYSTLSFKPDPVADLLFTGIAQNARKNDTAIGLQLEGLYKLTDAHTLRGGVIVQVDRAVSKTSSQVFFLDDSGNQTTDTPATIVDNSSKTQKTYSVFLQDEWALAEGLTLNYGLRYDRLESYLTEDQVSPRVNLVWKPLDGTTFHVGYARYFTPPPFELVASTSVAKFVGTTAEAPNGVVDDTPKSDRDDYFDVGAEQKLGGLTLGVDTYYKKAKNLLDEGQFGAPIINTPFNYKQGYAKGVELSASYVHGAFQTYGNVALSEAKGKNIISSQFNFDPGDLAYITNHYIFLDHNQTVSASAGVSYRWAGTRFSGDLIYGSGLRKGGDVPNGDHVPEYTQVNLAVSHGFDAGMLQGVTVRGAIINAFDEKYLIRDGSGVGVGAPQYGPRRGFYFGVSKTF